MFEILLEDTSCHPCVNNFFMIIAPTNPAETQLSNIKWNRKKRKLRNKNSCLCNFICKWLDFLVSSHKDDKPEVPSHNSLNVEKFCGTLKNPRTIRIRVGWSRCCGCLSYANEGWVRWGTFEWDIEVLLCTFLLGNKFCPVEWTRN